MLFLLFFSVVCFFGIAICLYYLVELYLEKRDSGFFKTENTPYFAAKDAANLLFGYVVLDDFMNPVKGGIVELGSKKAAINDQGKYILEEPEPGEQTVQVFYNAAVIYTGKITINAGVNQVNIKINKIIPAFMQKAVRADTTLDELFTPVAPKVYYRGNPELKRIAITIDDGWKVDWKLLELFEKYKARATVFLISGRGIGERNPEFIKKMDEIGIEVCSHTYTHSTLTKLTNQQVKEEIRKGQIVISKVTGKFLPYMRPSGGSYNQRVLEEVALNGQKIILWSNTIQDTVKNVTAAGQVKYVMANLKNGDIILCHFNAYHSYEVLEKIVPQIIEKGYELVTLSEVLEGLELK